MSQPTERAASCGPFVWWGRHVCRLVVLALFVVAAPICAGSEGYIKGPSNKRVIVFVNGVLGDGQSTWTHPSGSYWPRLLVNDGAFSDSDVYVHTFVSPPISAAQNIEELAGRMHDFLLTDGVFARHKEIVFLCHSMGGLVVRAMILKARLSPAQVPMIYFFGAPTAGANTTKLAAIISQNPQFQHMLPLRKEGYLLQLVQRWNDTSDDENTNYPNRIRSFCAYEKKDTYGVRVVEIESAILSCNGHLRAVLADHIDMVKPLNAAAEPYRFFKAAYIQQFGIVSPIVSLGLKSGSLDYASASRELHNAGYTQPIPQALIEGPKATLSANKAWIPIARDRKIPCGTTIRGIYSVDVGREADEEIVAAETTAGGRGVRSIGVAVTRIKPNRIEVEYKVVAHDEGSPMCEGEQFVWAELKYIKSRQQSSLLSDLFDFRK